MLKYRSIFSATFASEAINKIINTPVKVRVNPFKNRFFIVVNFYCLSSPEGETL